MQNRTKKKLRRNRQIKTSSSDYLFHLHEAPKAIQAKNDLLCEAQISDNQIGIDKIKIKLLTKSCQNFEPWQSESKPSFENQPKKKVAAVNQLVSMNNSFNKRSSILEKEKQYFKSQISLDKIKKCTSLMYEGKINTQIHNKRYHKNNENKTATSSFYSLRRVKDYQTFSQHKFETERSLSSLNHHKIMLSRTIRSEVRSRKNSANHEVIEIEHPLTSYTKTEKQMMGSTLRRKIPKNRQSNLDYLKNVSLNLCQAILIKKSQPIQKQIGKILKLLSQQKLVTGLL